MNLKLILRQQFSLPHRLPTSRPSRSRAHLLEPSRPSFKSFVLKPRTPSKLQHRNSSSSDRHPRHKPRHPPKKPRAPKLSSKMTKVGSQLFAHQLTLKVRNTEPLRKPRRAAPPPLDCCVGLDPGLFVRILPEEPLPRAPKIKLSRRLEQLKRDRPLEARQLQFISLQVTS
jgi:hypothetical protein